MKICKKCNKEFKSKIKIDGKTHVLSSRKYCLDCSPFKKHNTKQLQHPQRTRLEQSHIYQKRERHNRKQKLIEYKGGKCEKCGYDKCIAALNFHHTNPVIKKFELSKSNLCRYSFDVIKAESDKCILVCSNCHMEIHYNE